MSECRTHLTHLTRVKDKHRAAGKKMNRKLCHHSLLSTNITTNNQQDEPVEFYFPAELKVEIISYLQIVDLCKMCLQSRAWNELVEQRMTKLKILDFTNTGKTNLTSQLSNESLMALIEKCPQVEEIKAFFPQYHSMAYISKLSIAGTALAFSRLKKLQRVEIDNIALLEILTVQRPSVQIPTFRNGPTCELQLSHLQKKTLSLPNTSLLELENINLNFIIKGRKLERLSLTNVTLDSVWDYTFPGHKCPNLKSLKMRNTLFNSNPYAYERAKYYSAPGWSLWPKLEELHLVEVDGISWNQAWGGSRYMLKSVKLGRVTGMNPLVLHHLLFCCQNTLETLYMPRELCHDEMMRILNGLRFPSLKHLVLGYQDEEFKHNIPLTCQLTNRGIRIAASVFNSPHIETIEVHDCPLVECFHGWTTPGRTPTIYKTGFTGTFSKCGILVFPAFSFQKLEFSDSQSRS